jgi:hypothetical protein
MPKAELTSSREFYENSYNKSLMGCTDEQWQFLRQSRDNEAMRWFADRTALGQHTALKLPEEAKLEILNCSFKAIAMESKTWKMIPQAIQQGDKLKALDLVKQEEVYRTVMADSEKALQTGDCSKQ